MLPVREFLKDPYVLIATWFGTGLVRKAPGTVGSLASLPFALLIQKTLGPAALQIASIALFFGGIAVTERYMKRYDREGDPQEVVIDEVAGQWFCLAFFYPTWVTYILGFIFFRIFDIFKPWPVSWIQRMVPGGLGVMLDDLLAAMYAVLVVMVFVLLLKTNVQ